MPPKGKPIRIKETGKVLRGVRAVANHISGDHSTVAGVLRGERKTHKGYTFEVVHEQEED